MVGSAVPWESNEGRPGTVEGSRTADKRIPRVICPCDQLSAAIYALSALHATEWPTQGRQGGYTSPCLVAAGCTHCVDMDVSSPKHPVRTGLADIAHEPSNVCVLPRAASAGQAVVDCFKTDCGHGARSECTDSFQRCDGRPESHRVEPRFELSSDAREIAGFNAFDQSVPKSPRWLI